jgi:hypothetical protein
MNIIMIYWSQAENFRHDKDLMVYFRGTEAIAAEVLKNVSKVLAGAVGEAKSHARKMNSQGASREHSGNVQGASKEHSGELREHSAELREQSAELRELDDREAAEKESKRIAAIINAARLTVQSLLGR